MWGLPWGWVGALPLVGPLLALKAVGGSGGGGTRAWWERGP